MTREKEITMHDVAVELLKSNNPRYKDRGFMREIKDVVFEEAYSPDEVDFSVVPDLFMIDHDKHTIVALEVEDTSKLTMEKIAKYNQIAWMLDDIGEWGFKLLVANRYGTDIQQIPLFEFGLMYIKLKEKRDERERRTNAQSQGT